MKKIKILISSLALTLIFSGAAYSMTQQKYVKIGDCYEPVDEQSTPTREEINNKIKKENIEKNKNFIWHLNYLPLKKIMKQILQNDQELRIVKIKVLDPKTGQKEIPIDMLKVISSALSFFLYELARDNGYLPFYMEETKPKEFDLHHIFGEFWKVEDCLKNIEMRIKCNTFYCLIDTLCGNESSSVENIVKKYKINKEEIFRTIKDHLSKIYQKLVGNNVNIEKIHPLILLYMLFSMTGYDIKVNWETNEMKMPVILVFNERFKPTTIEPQLLN